jgi:hypothetical protein
VTTITHEHHANDLPPRRFTQIPTFSAMTPVLIPTNMSAAEMIPDNENPAHDPRYWCLPPVRDERNAKPQGGYPMYLVTQGRSVEVWHNW